MRSFVIRTLLPLGFCLVPLLAAGLVVLGVPQGSRAFYLDHMTSLDQFILGLGLLIFTIQIIMTRVALRWETTSFNETYDRSLSNLAQSAEWFPLLGLIGTVAGIMQTFAAFKPGMKVVQAEVIYMFAPAITATLSGLFMALINILPTWIVMTGRQIILKLGGEVTGIMAASTDPKPVNVETRQATIGQSVLGGGGQGTQDGLGS